MSLAICNQNGVYEPHELLTLDHGKNGYRGSPTAEIALVDIGDCWLWAADFSLMSDADCWGHGEPLSDWPSRRAESREAAIAAASAFYRERLGKRAENGSRDCRRILAWLDTLQPAQTDLFGAAA